MASLEFVFLLVGISIVQANYVNFGYNFLGNGDGWDNDYYNGYGDGWDSDYYRTGFGSFGYGGGWNNHFYRTGLSALGYGNGVVNNYYGNGLRALSYRNDWDNDYFRYGYNDEYRDSLYGDSDWNYGGYLPLRSYGYQSINPLWSGSLHNAYSTYNGGLSYLGGYRTQVPKRSVYK